MNVTHFGSGCSVGKGATGWTIGIRFPALVRIFLLAVTSKPALGHLASYPIDTWGSPAVKHEADHSRPSGVEFKKAWCFISALHICLHGLALSQEVKL